MSHVALLHAAAGVPHPLGFGVIDVMSAGMEARVKRQILIPALSQRWAKTPPLAALKPAPKDVSEVSAKPQPALSPLADRHWRPMRLEVYASELAVSKVQLPPAEPLCAGRAGG